MPTFDFTVKLSNIIYKWILDPSEGNPRGSLYKAIFSNDGNGGHGMEQCLFFLLFTSLAAAGVYYFVVASNIKQATKSNYVVTWIGGFICLLIINYLGLTVTLDADVFSSFNMIKLCFIDAAYYTVLFELWSLVMLPFSKAGNIHLLSLHK